MTTPRWRSLTDLARRPYVAAAIADGRFEATDGGTMAQVSEILREGDLDALRQWLAEDAPADELPGGGEANERSGSVDEDSHSDGCLMIVGLGIRLAGQMTAESEAAIRQADRVVYLAADPATSAYVYDLNPRARSLGSLYKEGKPRQQIYQEMVDEIVREVRAGRRVCFAIYGHPGVLVQASHRAAARVRAAGAPVAMLPGVSAEACLLADLGYDTGQGLQSYEATELLLYRRRLDPAVAAVVWQVGVVGILAHATLPDRDKVRVLADRLAGTYGGDHTVVVYEAAYVAGMRPLVQPVRLYDLPDVVTMNSTLFIPPREASQADLEVAARLAVEVVATERAPFRLEGHPTARTASRELEV